MRRFLINLFITILITLGLICHAYAQEKIAFASDRTGNYEIYTINPTGSNPKRITNHAGDDIQPSWSPDGKSLVFCSKRDGDWDIYTMQSAGSILRKLTSNSESDRGPAWSPDGRSIAFHSYRDGNWEIYVMNKDGSNKQNITNSTATQTYPSWSPDSRYIIYQNYNHHAAGSNWEIFRIGADGSSPIALTTDPAVDQYASWSPDGKFIAFWSQRDGSSNIYIMNSNGSNQRKVSDTPPSPEVQSRIAWSPDSRYIAFPRSHDIYKMDVHGTGLSRLTQSSSINTYPTWIAKSDSIVLKAAVLAAVAIPDYTAIPASGVLNGRSSAQLAFINQRGYPDLFSLGFVTEGVDRSGHVKSLVTPRRLESWAYNGNNFSSVLFDNGYFIKETNWGRRATLQPTQLKPTQFSLEMTEAQIIAMMGRPSCVETQQLAGRTYRYLRYNPVNDAPAATVVMKNGFFQSVSAGYALVDSSHTGTNLCTAR